jgi:hypothetical protein
MKNTKIIFIKLINIIFVFVFLFLFELNNSLAFNYTAFDSIAGYSTEITGEGSDNCVVKIIVKSPTLKIRSYKAFCDDFNKFSFIIPKEDTTVSGIYNFSVVKEHEVYSDGEEHYFEIFPDEPSNLTSKFVSIENSTFLSKKLKLTAFLYDKYHNPILNHNIKIYSDNSNDVINPVTFDKTDKNGEVNFWIYSPVESYSTLLAKDQTSGFIFNDKLNISFYKNINNEKYLYSDINTTLSLDITDNSSLVSKFLIEFPDKVTIDSDANYLKITALDSNGDIVKNFVGSIKIIIPTDDNDKTPGIDGIYKFLEKDQGEILFSRSVTFSKKGTHKLEVYLYQNNSINYNIFGKTTVIVEDKETDIIPDIIPIKLNSPSDKSSFSVSDISISGVGLPNSDLKVVLDKNPILDISIDSDGNYKGLIKNISDGEHLLSVYQKDNPDNESSEISFIVDTTASEILFADFEPKNANPEELIEVTVEIEDDKDMESLEVFYGATSREMKKEKTNYYTVLFPAPLKEGEYPIKIVLTDKLKNKKNKFLEIPLNINKSTPSLDSVIDLKANFDLDKKVLKLSWKPLENKPLMYIVHSGIEKEKLNRVKSVSGSMNNAFLQDLSEGKYFFAITATDIKNIESKRSKILEYDIVIPTKTPTPTPTKTPTPTPTKTPTPTPTKTPTPTPTKTPTPTPTKTPTPIFHLNIDSSENMLHLSWDKDINAVKYRLSYGLESRSYSVEQEIPKLNSYFTIKDLIPGVKYYVLLESLNNFGRVSYSYKEAYGIPIENNFHPAPYRSTKPYPKWVSETGAEIFISLGFLFLIISFWYFIKKDEK